MAAGIAQGQKGRLFLSLCRLEITDGIAEDVETLDTTIAILKHQQASIERNRDGARAQQQTVAGAFAARQAGDGCVAVRSRSIRQFENEQLVATDRDTDHIALRMMRKAVDLYGKASPALAGVGLELRRGAKRQGDVAQMVAAFRIAGGMEVALGRIEPEALARSVCGTGQVVRHPRLIGETDRGD